MEKFIIVLKNLILTVLIPVFKKYLGGPLGSGRQWFSWIHRDDLTQAFLFLLEKREISGPVNFTAPNPARNRALRDASRPGLGNYRQIVAAMEGVPGVKAASPAIMRRAAQISTDAHRRAMCAVKPGRAEYEIEANGLLKKEELNDRIEHLKLMQSIFVKRTKEGEKDKEIDVRPFVDDIRADENVLYLKLIMENGRSARVHEILQFLMPDGIDSLRLARVKRIGLWVQYGNLLVSPMDV